MRGEPWAVEPPDVMDHLRRRNAEARQPARRIRQHQSISSQ